MSHYSDDPPAQVWDRSRFEAVQRDRGDDGPVMERERVIERDHVHVRERSPSPPPRREAVFRESEEFDFRPRRERYYEEEERDTYEGAMVHKPRDRGGEERDIEIDIRRREYGGDDRRSSRPASDHHRPAFVRRQSSLDTHDRRPMPRPGDHEYDRRRRPSSGRYDDYYEEDYRYKEENFGGYREREVERVRRRRSPSPESTVVEEKEEVVERQFRKGKTKMPRRLVHKTALWELGYPYDEEGETIIIRYALDREDIDEVIALSKQMNRDGIVEETSKTVIYDKKSSRDHSRVYERKKEIIRESSPPSVVPESVAGWDQMVTSQGDWNKRQRRGGSPDETYLAVPTHRHRRRRSRAKSDAGSPQRAVILEEREESANITTGVGALVLKPQKHRRSKSIQKEIIQLETEREVLRKERRRSRPKVEILQGTEIVEAEGAEIVIAQEDDGIEYVEIEKKKKDDGIEYVEIEKKKKEKTPDPRVWRAMLATLT